MKEYDYFINNEFSASQWSAEMLKEPDEIKSLIESFNLIGKKITAINFIGFDYIHRRDDIEERAYNYLESLKDYEEERQHRSDYNNIPDDIMFARFAEIDEPMMIEFEDDDVFEIEAYQEPFFCMAMNSIPLYIKHGINAPNINASTLLSPCVGHTISEVQVRTYKTKQHPMYSRPFDEKESERTLVSDIVLRMDNGKGISISGWIDYCHVACIDSDDVVLDIPFSELKKALFNWEDIHEDEKLDFSARTSTFYFNKKGRAHADRPYMTLIPKNLDTPLYVSVEDFLLFDWSIIIQTKDWFDEYGDYTFSKAEWNQILSHAEKMLSFDSFDALFDYLIGLGLKDHRGENIFLFRLNGSGRNFWNRRDILAMQLEDMREWSDLAIGQDDYLEIYGF